MGDSPNSPGKTLNQSGSWARNLRLRIVGRRRISLQLSFQNRQAHRTQRSLACNPETCRQLSPQLLVPLLPLSQQLVAGQSRPAAAPASAPSRVPASIPAPALRPSSSTAPCQTPNLQQEHPLDQTQENQNSLMPEFRPRPNQNPNTHTTRQPGGTCPSCQGCSVRGKTVRAEQPGLVGVSLCFAWSERTSAQTVGF